MTAEQSRTEPIDAAPNPRPPRGGLVAAVVLVIGSLILTVVVGGALWLSGSWNGPSTSDPADSVDDFLTALLDDRDAEAAAGYTCASQSGDLGAALDVFDALPPATGSDGLTDFTWQDVTVVSEHDDIALVTAQVGLAVTGDTDTWTFAVVTGDPDNAWRVCGVDISAD